MRFKLLVLIILLYLCIHSAYGQWDAQVSQYWRVKTYYNPSFAGENNFIDNTIFHRTQWVGVNNAPKTSMVLIHMPFEFLDKKHGVGMHVFNEKIGLFSNTTTSMQYAYKHQFKKGRMLNIGLQGSLANIDFNASEIHIPNSEYHDQTDPAKPSGGEDKAFDMGLGVSWITPNYYVGFSVSHLWEPKFDLDDNHSSFIGRAYYLMGGYNIKLKNPLFVVQPSVFVKSDAITTQVDLTARLEYSKIVSGGIGWRKDDGFIFMLGLKIRNIEAGYAYDLTTSALSKVSNGSHEIFLRYIVPLDKKKEKGNQKSIRLL